MESKDVASESTLNLKGTFASVGVGYTKNELLTLTYVVYSGMLRTS